MSTQTPKTGAKIGAQAAKVSTQPPKAAAHAATPGAHAAGKVGTQIAGSGGPKIGAQAAAAPAAAKSKLTPEQRAWLKKLGAVVNSSGDGAVDTEKAAAPARGAQPAGQRSEEHTSELQSHSFIS